MKRTEQSIKNFKINTAAQIVNLIVQFVSRTLFIKILGKTYLGVNGLFSNILTILSLADMGIGTVLIYSMYEPLAKSDYNKINGLLKIYKKIYNIIALIVLITGLILTPFLEYIIKDNTNIPNLHLIFILYLLNTVVSYLCIYKISIINADQKNYIVTSTQQFFNVVSNFIMIVALYLTHNYLVYLLVQIAFSIISNVYLTKKAEKMYSFIKEKRVQDISINEKQKIKKNTIAMFFHKIGGVVVSGTDNIVMSAMVGIQEVGVYSNYILIINAIKRFSSQYFNSIIASIGNLNTENNDSHTLDIFKKVLYGNFVIYSFSSICLLVLFNAFIKLWVGELYLFNNSIVFCIVLEFYIDGMRQTCLTFKEAKGIFVQDQFKPICEAIINLAVSILLTYKIGIIGIMIGTIVSMIFSTIVESYVLFKYGFKKSVKKYLEMILYYTTITLITYVIVIFVVNHIPAIGSDIISFIIRTCLTIALTLTIIIGITHNSEEFKYFYKKILKKK